ncbi:hypothetical protein LCGC14_1376700 [marine sediment metagenome]|uniref:Flagellin N-terminal domain-containing protein n=1 Tax=marine sediment metagenome TaxID=412755 RepID=A0A0F9N5V9_9ZZZZ
MPFRATNVIPSAEYERAKQAAVQVRRLAQNRSSTFASGATSAEVLAVADNLSSMKATLESIRGVPGIGVYANAQEDDDTYDVAAAFNAMLAAIDSVIAEIVSALPKDQSDWLLINKINEDGSLSARSFTGAALTNLRTTLDVLVASIT